MGGDISIFHVFKVDDAPDAFLQPDIPAVCHFLMTAVQVHSQDTFHTISNKAAGCVCVCACVWTQLEDWRCYSAEVTWLPAAFLWSPTSLTFDPQHYRAISLAAHWVFSLYRTVHCEKTRDGCDAVGVPVDQQQSERHSDPAARLLLSTKLHLSRFFILLKMKKQGWNISVNLSDAKRIKDAGKQNEI